MSDTDLRPELRPDTRDDAAADTRMDADDRLRPDFVREVIARVDSGDDEGARTLVSPLHPADLADLFELAPGDRRAAMAAALGDLLDGDVLAEMNDHVREGMIDALDAAQVAEIASELDTDDAVAIIEDMDDADQAAVLRALDPDDRAAIEAALSYPEESAGRLMQRELIAVPEHWSVGQVIDYLRDNADLTTDFWEIFIVDPTHKPIGTCQLSWILRTPRTIAIADVMKREQTLIPVDMDQEEVALRFQKYALISAAVVDPGGRLVGQITVDDIVHIIQEEAGEDVLLLSGAGEGPCHTVDWYRAARNRCDSPSVAFQAAHETGQCSYDILWPHRWPERVRCPPFQDRGVATCLEMETKLRLRREYERR